MKAEKSLAMKMKIVDEDILGPKHKVLERTAIFDPQTEELLADENEILATTLKYNIGVLTKNKGATQDLPEVQKKNKLNKDIMKDKTKGAPLSAKTYTAVLKHFKKKKKNMFRHITKRDTTSKTQCTYTWRTSWTMKWYQTHMTTQNFWDCGKVKAAS